MQRTRQRVSATIGAMALALGLTGPAAAQGPTKTQAANRTQTQFKATTKVEDTLAQRLQACTPCHGQQGVATPNGYFPRIAGKPQGYLFEQLLNFKEARRGHATMQHLVQPLSTSYLLEIAGYFSALDLPYPPPEAVDAPAAVIQRGRKLAQDGDPALKLPACTACHGTHLTGALPATPGLLGLSKDYLTAQLGAWRNDLRRARVPDCMKHISDRLTDADIHAVTAFLASQPVPQDSRAVQPVQAPAEPKCAAPRAS